MLFSDCRQGALACIVLAVVVACGNDDTPTEPSGRAQVGAPCNADSRAFIDADGDGYAATAEGAIECSGAGAFPPIGYTGLLGDCDDSNAKLVTLYLSDADGDGFSPSEEKTVCGPKTSVPVGAVGDSTGRDCDDSDPTLARWGRRDADQDSFPGKLVECLGVDLPQGYVGASKPTPDPSEVFDCDEQRADVHPHALELWSDQLDSDCDGHASIPEGCLGTPCDQPVEVDEACASADLAIVELAPTSSGCEELSWVVVVANRGNATVSTLAIHVEDGENTMIVDIAEPLAPGVQRGYKLWGFVDGGNVTATVSSPAVDCQPSNNQKTFVDLIGASCRI